MSLSISDAGTRLWETAVPSAALRILTINEDRQACQIAEVMLKSLAQSCDHGMNPTSALRLALEKDYDVVLSVDQPYEMKNSLIIATLRKLTRGTARPPIIIMAATGFLRLVPGAARSRYGIGPFDGPDHGIETFRSAVWCNAATVLEALMKPRVMAMRHANSR